jgi:hypothetical protein
MSDFELYFIIGLKHVLDSNAYDHVLFLMALAVPYLFKEWRNILLLVTLFTMGHTVSLILSVYGIIIINPAFIEFLIPITILITALVNLRKCPVKYNSNVPALVTLFFGLIHGFGFSNYFKMLMSGNTEDKMASLLEFALGIEAAQVIVVVAVLTLNHLVLKYSKVNRRDWILAGSCFVAGLVAPMIIASEIW